MMYTTAYRTSTILKLIQRWKISLNTNVSAANLGINTSNDTIVFHELINTFTNKGIYRPEVEKVVDPASIARRKYLTKSLSGRNFLAKITLFLSFSRKKQYNNIFSALRKNFL